MNRMIPALVVASMCAVSTTSLSIGADYSSSHRPLPRESTTRDGGLDARGIVALSSRNARRKRRR